MILRISPSTLHGNIHAVASKSVAHRLLICAAFADAPSKLQCSQTNDDILATAGCLCALGADIKYDGNFFTVTPIQSIPQHAELDCAESGSTLRFLLPVVAALGCDTTFRLRGRLPHRPLSPLREELERHGISLSPSGLPTLTCRGKLSADEYRIRGDVSSQFISGLLFALSLSDRESHLIPEGKIESAPYIRMTQDALATFGAPPRLCEDGYLLGGLPLRSCAQLQVEGDWSGAAFALCAGALSKQGVFVHGMRADSHQGDRAILDILRQFGATVKQTDNSIFVCGDQPLRGITLDATQIPDLVPVLAVTAMAAEGKTVIYGAERLRSKESDRLQAVCALLSQLGGEVQETADGLILCGAKPLRGGEVDAFGDHRIAMSAAVAATLCQKEVILTGAESVSKSYPSFWEDFAALGLRYEPIG